MTESKPTDQPRDRSREAAVLAGEVYTRAFGLLISWTDAEAEVAAIIRRRVEEPMRLQWGDTGGTGMSEPRNCSREAVEEIHDAVCQDTCASVEDHLGWLQWLQSVIRRLVEQPMREEIQRWRTASACELAADNPSIADFIKHWTERANQAEAALAAKTLQFESACRGIDRNGEKAVEWFKEKQAAEEALIKADRVASEEYAYQRGLQDGRAEGSKDGLAALTKAAMLQPKELELLLGFDRLELHAAGLEQEAEIRVLKAKMGGLEKERDSARAKLAVADAALCEIAQQKTHAPYRADVRCSCAACIAARALAYDAEREGR